MSRHFFAPLTSLVVFVALLAATARPALAAERFVDASAAPGGDGSSDKPFRTISDALAATAGPGDIVTVRAGIYRESLYQKFPSGAPNEPFTLRAAPGATVVVSGAVVSHDWQPGPNGTFTTLLQTKPDRLLLDNRPLLVARQPNEGWWSAKNVQADAIIDPEHLKSLASDSVVGSVFVWTKKGNTFITRNVEALDRASGTLRLATPPKSLPALTADDRYYLTNNPSYIDLPGEWSVTAEGEQFRVAVLPPTPQDLERIEIPTRGTAIALRSAQHVIIDGLQITGATEAGVQIDNSSQNITLRNCVVHNNGRRGVSVHNAQHINVQRCLIARNEYGLSLVTVVGATIEETEIAHHLVDGLLVTWNTSDVTIRRCYLHHHLLYGHPDNMQIYREVRNVKLEDSLLLAGGQGLMTEQLYGMTLTGNTIVGSGAFLVIFGHKSSDDITLRNNTLGLAGYGLISLTGKDYHFNDNIFFAGHNTSIAYSTKGIEGYTGNNNLFWPGQRAMQTGATIVRSDKGSHRNLESFANATGQDKNSVVEDPQFRNAPVAYGVLDAKKLAAAQANSFDLRSGAGALFKTDDYIELDFDSVVRRITHVAGNTITFTPALPALPSQSVLVVNWGDNKDFRMDLRVKPQSPAARMDNDKPVGSTVDIQGYRAGDFDGDGKRDLPQVPEGLEL